MIGWGCIAVGLQLLVFSLFLRDCGDLLELKDYPFFSVGLHAKGFIAVGVFARGIVSFGILSQGLLTFSFLGSGLIVFIGLWGVSWGFGIYQLGVSWYCYLGQISISLYGCRKVQLGVSVLGPACNEKIPRFIAQ